MEIFGSAVAVILLWKRYTDQQRGSHEKSLVYLSDKCDPGLRGTALRLLKETDYKPPLYLPFEIHGQLQTCMQYSVRNISRVCMQLFRMRDLVVFDRELLTLSDGGTIALDWGSHFHADQCAPLTASSPVVILFHGLVGDSQSEYIFHMSGQLLKRGYRVVAVVARGCGGLSLTTGRVFAGRRTSDVASAIHTVADRYPSAKLFGVGFSLGASLVLQYLSEEHRPHENGSSFAGMSHAEAHSPLTAAVVVSPPWDLCTNSLEPALVSRLWSLLLVVPIKLHLLLHHQYLLASSPELYGKISLYSLMACFTLTQVETLCYSCYYRASGGSYESVEAYYNDISPVHSAHFIHTPTVCLTSMDDPICMHSHCPTAPSDIGPGLVVVKTPWGGHLAYPEGPFPLTTAWTDRIVAAWFENFL